MYHPCFLFKVSIDRMVITSIGGKTNLNENKNNCDIYNRFNNNYVFFLHIMTYMNKFGYNSHREIKLLNRFKVNAN